MKITRQIYLVFCIFALRGLACASQNGAGAAVGPPQAAADAELADAASDPADTTAPADAAPTQSPDAAAVEAKAAQPAPQDAHSTAEVAQDAATLPPAAPKKPTECVVNTTTNFIKGLVLDQLPPNFAFTTPVRPAAKPNTWANNGLTFKGQPSLVESHVIQAYQDHVYVAEEENNRLLDYAPDLSILRHLDEPKIRGLSVTLGGTLYTLSQNGRIGVLAPGAEKLETLLDLNEAVSCFLIWKNQYILIGNPITGEVSARSLLDGVKVWQAQTYGAPRSLASDGTSIFVTLERGSPRRFLLPKLWTADPAGATQLPTIPLELRGDNPWHANDSLLGNFHPQWPSSHAFAATNDGSRVLVAHSLAVTGSTESIEFANKAGIDPSLVSTIQKALYYGFVISDPCVSVPVRPLEMAVTAYENGERVPTLPNLVTRDPLTDRNWLAQFDQPIDMRVHPTRTLAFVAARGTDNVLVLNTRSVDPMQLPIAVLQTGQGPIGVAVSETKPYAYTFNLDSRTVTRIPLAPLLSIIDSGSEMTKMAAPLLLPTDLTVALPGQSWFESKDWRAGRRLFHAANNPLVAAAGRQACASCHINGRDDKLVWATKTGMRQTVSLAGRIEGTEPYGWTGEFLWFIDKIDQGVAHMGGTGLSSEDRGRLVLYLKALKLPTPQYSAPPWWLYEQGKALFEDPVVGCSGCHTGAKLTDAKSWDVGTSTAMDKQFNGGKPVLFDTPSLLGVGSSAPYLHDGSATTLWEVVDHSKNQMGGTAQLNASQTEALVAYLQTL